MRTSTLGSKYIQLTRPKSNETRVLYRYGKLKITERSGFSSKMYFYTEDLLNYLLYYVCPMKEMGLNNFRKIT